MLWKCVIRTFKGVICTIWTFKCVMCIILTFKRFIGAVCHVYWMYVYLDICFEVKPMISWCFYTQNVKTRLFQKTVFTAKGLSATILNGSYWFYELWEILKIRKQFRMVFHKIFQILKPGLCPVCIKYLTIYVMLLNRSLNFG